MKCTLLALATFILYFSGMAQTTPTSVSGYVIDKKGNRVPGVTVTTDKGNESAVTDIDGKFLMELNSDSKKVTANYLGRKTNTAKLQFEKDIVLVLGEDHAMPFFINEVFGLKYVRHNSAFDKASSQIAIMAGQLGKWGWYVKPSYVFGFYHGYDVSVGVIKSLKNRTWFGYLGGGFSHTICHENEYIHYADWYWSGDYRHYFSSTYPITETNSRSNLLLELGFIVRPAEHIDINCGVTGTMGVNDYRPYYGTFTTMGFQVGVGYVF